MNRKPTYTELTKSVIELTTALDYERKKKAECEDILENANSLILKMSPDGIMRVVTKDARELIIEYRNSIIYDHGKPIGVHGAARDITRRVKTEEQLRISEEKFSKVFRNSPMWVVLSVVETGRYIDVNDSFLCSTGYQRDEVINKTSIELGLWVDPDQRKKILKEVKEKGSVQDIEVNRRIKSGQIITMLFFGEIIEIGEETCFLSVSLDITDRKRMEMLVRESEKRYRTVLQVNPDPIVLYDINGKVTYANPAFEKTFGWTYNELAGKHLDFVPKENRPETQAAIESMLRGKKITTFETKRQTKNGSVLDVQISAAAFKDQNDNLVGNIVTLRDITDRKAVEEKLWHKASHDALTGLFNRHYFKDQLALAIQSAKRYEYPLSVCFCDLDKFKQINDTYGHKTGDEVLVAFGKILRENIRSDDIAARYGGDEFCILFPHTSAIDAAISIERIRTHFQDLVFDNNREKNFSVSATFGITELRDNNETESHLLNSADQALYKAKELGRNRVVINDDEGDSNYTTSPVNMDDKIIPSYNLGNR